MEFLVLIVVICVFFVIARYHTHYSSQKKVEYVDINLKPTGKEDKSVEIKKYKQEISYNFYELTLINGDKHIILRYTDYIPYGITGYRSDFIYDINYVKIYNKNILKEEEFQVITKEVLIEERPHDHYVLETMYKTHHKGEEIYDTYGNIIRV